MVVGAAVEVGDGSRRLVPVDLVDGVAVFARGGDEAHCCGCGDWVDVLPARFRQWCD